MGTAKADLIPLPHSIGPSQSVKRPSELALRETSLPWGFQGAASASPLVKHLFEPKVSIGTETSEFLLSSPQKGLFHLLFDGSLQPILKRKFQLTLLLCNLAIHFDD